MNLFDFRPGETPIDDVSELLIPGITLRRELEIAEAENIDEAVSSYLTTRESLLKTPFDFTFALQLHRDMFGKVWGWAGKLRHVDLNLGDPWQQVETQLYDLFANLPFWSSMPTVEQAARLHHEAVRVHPFMNGNGRWSRLLANVWLFRNDEPLIVWPEAEVAGGQVRSEYLDAVRAADQHDFDLLIELHRRYQSPRYTPPAGE